MTESIKKIDEVKTDIIVSEKETKQKIAERANISVFSNGKVTINKDGKTISLDSVTLAKINSYKANAFKPTNAQLRAKYEARIKDLDAKLKK